MLTDILRVLVYKLFKEFFYEKKLLLWQLFILLIKVVLKFFYNSLLSYVLRASDKTHKLSSCHNTPT